MWKCVEETASKFTQVFAGGYNAMAPIGQGLSQFLPHPWKGRLTTVNLISWIKIKKLSEKCQKKPTKLRVWRQQTLFLTWSLVLHLLLLINLIHYQWIIVTFPHARGGNIWELISGVGVSSSILKDFLYWSVECTELLQLQTFIFQYSEDQKSNIRIWAYLRSNSEVAPSCLFIQ